jgi:hypothetical protein
VALVFTYFTAPLLQVPYCSLVSCSGGFFGLSLLLVVLMLYAYLIFVPLFLIGFGDRKKYWWTGVLVALMFLLLFYLEANGQDYLLAVGATIVGSITGFGFSKLKPLVLKN